MKPNPFYIFSYVLASAMSGTRYRASIALHDVEKSLTQEV